LVVKISQFRKNLKMLLEVSSKEDLFLDYYGELYKIVPVKKGSQKLTQSQRIIDKYSRIKPKSIKSKIFDELDPAKEKNNFRNLKYYKHD
jgi:hypothetical protein